MEDFYKYLGGGGGGVDYSMVNIGHFDKLVEEIFTCQNVYICAEISIDFLD